MPLILDLIQFIVRSKSEKSQEDSKVEEMYPRGVALKRYRTSRGLSQEDMGHNLNRHRKTIHAYETQKSQVPDAVWERFLALIANDEAQEKSARRDDAKELDEDDIVTFWRKRGAMFRRYRSEVWDKWNRILTVLDYLYFGALSVVVLFTLSVNGVLPQVPPSDFFVIVVLISFVVFTLGTPLIAIETYKFIKRLKADFAISPTSPNALSIAQDVRSTPSPQ